MFGLTVFDRGAWSLLDDLSTMQRDMNRAFSDWGFGRTPSWRRRVAYPPVNVWSGKDGAMVLDVELPGVEPDEVDIAVNGDQLTLTGKINVRPLDEGVAARRRERAAGDFARTLQLPYRVNANKVKATYRNGVLRVEAPRAEEDKARKIAIEAA